MPETLAERLTDWRMLTEGLKPRLETEVPFLKEDHEELTSLVQQIVGLMHQSDIYEGRLREAVRQRLLAEEQAAELYGRMVARLKGTYGKRANALTEMGLRPDSPPGQKGRKEEPQQPPAPAGTPTQPTAPAPASAQQEEPPPASDR